MGNRLRIITQATFINLWLFFSCLLGLLASPIYRLSGTHQWDTNYFTGRLFAWGALRIAGLRLDVENRGRLEASRPCVIVGNHQSGLDVATFGGLIPHSTVGIGKIELLWVPFFGQYFWAAKNIIIKRQDRRHSMSGLAKAVDAVRRHGVSIFIFPEGTRNRTHDLLLPFKKGAFHMAIDAQVPIVPVVQQSLRDVVSWQDRKIAGGVLRMKVLDPIPTVGMTKADIDLLSQMTRERMLEAIRGLA